jgi:hypothetical protein
LSKVNQRREAGSRKLCELNELFDSGNFDAEQFSSELKECFQNYAPKLASHKLATNMVEYGPGESNDPDEITYAFKIKGTQSTFIASILILLEGVDIPINVSDTFPDLTKDELNAALRLASNILLSFQRTVPRNALEV